MPNVTVETLLPNLLSIIASGANNAKELSKIHFKHRYGTRPQVDRCHIPSQHGRRVRSAGQEAPLNFLLKQIHTPFEKCLDARYGGNRCDMNRRATAFRDGNFSHFEHRLCMLQDIRVHELSKVSTKLRRIN